MFSLGGSELLIIAVLVVLFFGPDKLPQLARTIGRYTREFNKYKDIMESTLRAELYRAETGPSEPEVPVEDRIAQAAAAGTELRDQMATSAAVAVGTGAESVVQKDTIPFAVTDEADEEEEE
jgi:TatA/E family protein of Tat protein translocase